MLYHHDLPPQPTGQGRGLYAFMFKVQGFTSLYPLNFNMDLVGTLPVVRYWFAVLCSTIITCLCNLQVKAMMVFESYLLRSILIFLVKSFWKSISLEHLHASSLYFACC